MKLTGFMCLFFVFTAMGNGFSQQKVNMKLGETTVKAALIEFQRQTQRMVIYSDDNIESSRRVVADFTDIGVEEFLKALLEGSNMTYRMMEGYVVITRQDKVSVPQREEHVVKGKVVDEKGHPLPGVTVVVKGSKLGVSTDANGDYRIMLPHLGNITISFSFIGMETREIKYAGTDTINVVMREAVSQLEEVIVSTGYQHINLRETTSAIQSIKAEDIVVSGLTSIDQMLEGHIPGMVFMQNSGQIGVTPRIRIRGTSTILGSQEPLWVVDGIVQQNPVDVDPEQINNLDFVNLLGNAITGLNPDDVEQIDILKDASATALYGARAANGVIVITTKKGKPGPPVLSYSLSGTFMRRPHYSDASVNMMNSAQRVDYSRELIEKRINYPRIEYAWLGYEDVIRDYWEGKISFDEMQAEVGRYESVNTDWFDILMQNSYSHKHTLNLSGGSSALRYYVSVGYSNAKGSIRGEENKQYTTSVNLTANYNRWNIHFNFSGNVDNKQYTPSDVGVTKYAYETTRALPAYNEDGSLWYYTRLVTGSTFCNFNIINEKRNSSQDIRSKGMTVTTLLNYKITDFLKAAFTASYSTNNTTQDVWHGEDSFYAEQLRLPPNVYGDDQNLMPYGGELKYQNTERYAYTIRGQVDFNKSVDRDEKHLLTSSVGGEMSSNQYYGVDRTFRGYLKERGKKMAAVDPVENPAFARWLGQDKNALGIWTDKLTNIMSAYTTVSYTYNNIYAVNANVRLDASNRFGSRANEKLAPIWSLSFRWNTKNDVLRDVRWLNDLSIRGSFGYQGNMLEDLSAKLVLERGGMDADFKEYESTVLRFPNPDLKWEKTESYNVTLDFSLFRNRMTGNISYFYKHTRDAFLAKAVSAINAVDSWVVNEETLENQGMELALRVVLIDNRFRKKNGLSWSISPNVGQILNKVSGNSKDKTLSNDLSFKGLLDGTCEVGGRPLNSFYSYRYLSLNTLNGMPMLYGSDRYVYIDDQKVDLLEKYQNSELIDIYMDAMTYSGTRVPTIQGGVQNSINWGRFSVSMNLSYSFGSKIRLLQMYPEIASVYMTVGPQPTANVRKEFLNRWRKPGDELYTNVPGIISGTTFSNTTGNYMWWSTYQNMNSERIQLADNLWSMYDKSDLRTVSGNFVKIQSLSVRYNIPDRFRDLVKVRSAYVGLSGTNLHTFCHKRLKGQDPATQNGTAPTINMSLRPTYSFNLNVSF